MNKRQTNFYSSNSENQPVLFVIGAVVLINALLLYSISLLPFIDLPNHLAEATIYKYKDTDALLGTYYKAVPWYYPNTFHTVFCSLFSSVEFGNKTFYLLYIASLLLATYGIIKELGGNLWYGLLTVLFLYNFNVIGGFTGFVIALPATFLLFYVLLLDARQERLHYKLSAALLLVLLYLMHAQMALFGLALYGCMMLYRYWGQYKKLLLSLLFIPLPVLAMVVFWWFNRAAAAPTEEGSTIAYLASYYKKHYLPEFLMRFRLAVFDNFSLQAGWKGLAIAGFIFILPFLPLLYYKVWKKAETKPFLHNHLIYSLIFLGIGLGCYFILPSKLPGQAPLYERFSTVVILAVIITGSVLLKNRYSRGLVIFVLGASLISTVLWINHFYAFNKENKAFSPALLKGIEPGAKLGGLMYDYRYRGRYTYLHFPNYFIVWNKGIAASKIIDYRFGVVQRGAKGAEIPFYNEWIGRTYSVEKTYDTTLHYLLVRGNAPTQPDLNLANFQLVKKEGPWQLYKNKQLPL